MNIYLLEQNEATGYDTYDSMVVVAESEDDARQMSPETEYMVETYLRIYGTPYSPRTWCAPEYVKVTLLGSSLEDEPRVIIASFNAG
jgi:hypothetical protein